MQNIIDRTTDEYLRDLDLNAKLVAKVLQEKLYPIAARLVEDAKKKSEA
jgi:hypothetical protein